MATIGVSADQKVAISAGAAVLLVLSMALGQSGVTSYVSVSCYIDALIST